MSAATCALLSSGVAPAADEFETEVGASSLLYHEIGRVTVSENSLLLKHEFRDDEFVTAKAVFDVMSGVSPSGAAKIAGDVQTITSPSGHLITIQGDQTPSFSFSDIRSALTLGWLKPLSRTLNLSLDATGSKEEDYSSLGASASLSKELFKKMTTLSFGLGGSLDNVEPRGGIPVGLTSSTSSLSRKEEESKQILDSVVGITQILNRKSLMQLNYSIGYSTGYLTDPYKIISYLDSATDEPRTGDPYYFEQRPSERLRQNIYLKYLHGTRSESIDASYRFFWDDWGVQSHTFDMRYEYDLSKGASLQWHARVYGQSRADFYHYFLYDDPVDGIAARDVTDAPGDLSAASGDYRLGSLNTYTFGAKYSLPSSYGVFSVRSELMVQHDRKQKFEPVFAFITQLVWRLKFF